MTKIYIQLGRIGDIMGILPLMWADAQTGQRNKLMVAAEFGPLLDGVSYVEPVIYHGPHFEIAKAVSAAGNNGPVVCLQINGPKEQVLEATYKPAGQSGAQASNFQKEAYRVAGRAAEWGQHPLVFDRRSPEREAELVAKWMPKKAGYVLIATSGHSSPFPHADQLRDAVNFVCPNVIDLDQVTASRFYDLLGLYEKARLLIATDSAPLHLADAVPDLPVIALANDKPILWNGSCWRPNHAAYCRYSDFPSRVVELMQVMREPVVQPDAPCFIDVWNAYEHRADRTLKARKAKYGKMVNLFWPMPVELGACSRDAANTAIKDEKRVPYLRDCLRMALQRAREGDYICLTRPDTEFNHAEVGNLAKSAPCYAYRLNDGKGFAPVVDLFCAHRDWWQGKLAEIPDLLFGSDIFWSQALWAIFSKAGARDVTGMVYRQTEL